MALGSVVVVGLVRPRTGPWHKLRAWSSGFTADGLATVVIDDQPTLAGVRRVAQQLRRSALPAATGDRRGPGLILLRSHWSVPLLFPVLLRARRNGYRLAVEVPTPVGAAGAEIISSARSMWARILRLFTEWVWSPMGWLIADLVVQTCADSRPWCWIATDRRLTLTNGAVYPTDHLASGWYERSSLHLLALGTISRWHGVDRLIAGMAESRNDATLVIAGEGPELPRLRQQVRSAGLCDRVAFAGQLTGDQLDEAYSAADAAVGSLAEHRRGSFTLSPLKTRDFLWCGLPVVYTGDDPDLRSAPAFTLQLPADETPVDVAEVRRWLARLRAGSNNAATIHAFAEKRFDYQTRARQVWQRAQRSESTPVSANEAAVSTNRSRRSRMMRYWSRRSSTIA